MLTTDHPLYNSFCQLAGQLRYDHNVAVIGLISPFSYSGTSHTARELALLAAQHYSPQGKRVALIDFDLDKPSQKNFFGSAISQSKYGVLSGPYNATFGQAPFWQISPEMMGEDQEKSGDKGIAELYLVGETGLAITGFNWSQLKEGQRAHIVRSTEYWDALRAQFAFVVVDCPAFDRNDTALTLVPDADSIVLVCLPSQAHDPGQASYSNLIHEQGGICLGQIINAGVPAIGPAQSPAS